MITKVKFKGADGSLGFIKGATYFLHFTTTKTQIKVVEVGYNGQPCLYDSLKLFLENWELLE